MIQALLFGGGILSALVWLVGLAGVWSGRPSLSLYAATGGLTTGILCTFAIMALPRYSEFWFGAAGRGDGFGLLGLLIFSAGLTLASLLALVLAAAVGSFRGKNNNKEVS